MLAIEAILKADTMWGERKEGRRKKKENLAPAQRNQAVFCDTLKKKKRDGLPTRSHATGADTLFKLLPVQFSFSLPQRSGKDAHAKRWLS